MHLVQEILNVKPFSIDLLFANGEYRRLNMENLLKQWSSTEDSIYKALLNKEEFAKVSLDKEMMSLVWPNGVDFCPDMLYQWSEKTTNYGA